MPAERLEVSRDIAAAPDRIFALLCDPQGHVRIDSSGMLQGAEGDHVRAVGDEFVVHMDRQALGDLPLGRYDVRVIITAFTLNAELEWRVSGTIQPPIGHRYGYRLVPSATGTTVTSYYDWSQILDRYQDVFTFPVVPATALGATLGILARTVEQP